MAKRSTGSRAIVVNTPRQAAPVIRMTMPKPIVSTKPQKRRRSHAKVGGGNASSEKVLLGVAIGGAALGFLEKQTFIEMLPELPLVGRKGAIAIAAYMLHKRGMGGAIMRDIAIAAAATAGYQLGKEGKISGPGDE